MEGNGNKLLHPTVLGVEGQPQNGAIKLLFAVWLKIDSTVLCMFGELYRFNPIFNSAHPFPFSNESKSNRLLVCYDSILPVERSCKDGPLGQSPFRAIELHFSKNMHAQLGGGWDTILKRFGELIGLSVFDTTKSRRPKRPHIEPCWMCGGCGCIRWKNRF